MATVATISVNFAQYDSTSFTSAGVIDRSINPKTLSQYCLGSSSADLAYLGGFVKKTGDSISGYLTLPSSDPTSIDHATRKGYVDSRIDSLSATVNSASAGGFVRISGSTMVGNLILNTSAPSTSLQASSKGYVDSRIQSLSSTTDTKLSNEFLAKSGGTMSGDISMNGNKITGLPTSPATTFIDSDAVTKKYVDTLISGATSGGASIVYVNQQDGLRVAKTGDTMTGALVLPSTNPATDNEAARKGYVDTKVAKSGDTMTGFLTLHANPTATSHASNKGYVDSSVATVATAAATAQTTANSAATAASNANTAAIAAQTSANSAATAASNANSNANNRVLRSGDTMTGNLAVQGTITATGDITAFSDIRTKKNINNIDNALDKILKLKGVTFDRISDNKKSLGLIAQDVLTVIPEVVREENEGYLSLAYGNIVAVLIEAIKELNEKVEILENKNI